MESNATPPCISGNLKTSQAVEAVKLENVHAYSAVDARDAAKICCVSLSQWCHLVSQGKAPPPHPRHAWIDVMMWSVRDLVQWLRKRAVERPTQAEEINEVLSAIREETIEWKKRRAEFAKAEGARPRPAVPPISTSSEQSKDSLEMLRRLGLGDIDV